VDKKTTSGEKLSLLVRFRDGHQTGIAIGDIHRVNTMIQEGFVDTVFIAIGGKPYVGIDPAPQDKMRLRLFDAPNRWGEGTIPHVELAAISPNGKERQVTIDLKDKLGFIPVERNGNRDLTA